jgi:hypothetical protein
MTTNASTAAGRRFEGEHGPDRQYQITIYRYYGYA